MLVPSGRTSARYPPLTSSLELVCKAAPGTARSLPEANTTRAALAARLVAGRRHLVGLPESSVRYQPSRATVVGPGLKSSIQSELSPSSSNSVLEFAAMNSVMDAVAGSPWAPVRCESHSTRHRKTMRRNGGHMDSSEFNGGETDRP